MNKFYKMLILLVIIQLSTPVCYSWDGYDYERGNYIEIQSGNYVRPGNEIEVYDYEDGEYKYYDVESVNGNEVEVYDYETDEYRTFDMD